MGRVEEIRKYFELGEQAATAVDAPAELPAPGAGEIILITGPSGSGKSSLLRALRRQWRPMPWIDVNATRLPRRRTIDCLGRDIDEALLLLSRVGLGEAWTYVRRPSELSEGQRWRLRLAMAVSRARRRRAVLACDEFAALLDRVTAAVVARALRRMIVPESGVSAVAATSHEDLVQALRPDVLVRCDFGQIEVRRCGT